MDTNYDQDPISFSKFQGVVGYTCVTKCREREAFIVKFFVFSSEPKGRTLEMVWFIQKYKEKKAEGGGQLTHTWY